MEPKQPSQPYVPLRPWGKYGFGRFMPPVLRPKANLPEPPVLHILVPQLPVPQPFAYGKDGSAPLSPPVLRPKVPQPPVPQRPALGPKYGVFPPPVLSADRRAHPYNVGASAPIHGPRQPVTIPPAHLQNSVPRPPHAKPPAHLLSSGPSESEG